MAERFEDSGLGCTGRHGSIECPFEFADYKVIIK